MQLNQAIEIICGDIVREEVDAIVNAANSSLAGGGGVDGAIHSAAGPAVMEELCRRYRGCPTGSAVITGAGKLKARYIIHAVGPIWQGGSKNEMGLLAQAVRTSLTLAAENLCQTIAFPAISTGVYAYPLWEAAKISLQTASEFLKTPSSIQKIRFVLFSEEARKVFQRMLDESRQRS